MSVEAATEPAAIVTSPPRPAVPLPTTSEMLPAVPAPAAPVESCSALVNSPGAAPVPTANMAPEEPASALSTRAQPEGPL